MSRPTLNWGILGTGWVSTHFVKDLVLPRPDAPALHQVRAIGTSSIKKGQKFVEQVYEEAGPDTVKPQIYISYDEVYTDNEVDIVYVGTPHALHKKNCLDAIAAGKHVLCEKPFTVNAREAREVVEAAVKRGVFVMEAVWTRFLPLVQDLQRRLNDSSMPLIGQLHRMLFDFSMNMNLASLPPTSRLKDNALGAGALLDIGIYGITFARVLLGPETQPVARTWNELQEVVSTLVVDSGIDISGVIVLRYNNPTRIAVVTTNTDVRTPPEFMRLEGTDGVVVVEGPAGSCPLRARVTYHDPKRESEIIEPKHGGMGFFFEADAVAQDIAMGRTQNATMPLIETIRVLELMDNIRRSAGVDYPQDM